MNDDAIRALRLIDTDPRDLLVAGHALVNRNVRALLNAGLIVHAPARRSGYRLTVAGRAAIVRGA